MNFAEFPNRPDQNDSALAKRARAVSRSTWISVAVNTVLTLIQIAIGIVARSQALIADGIHSLSDLLGDFVVLFASHHGKMDADRNHPYGHQRFETAASLGLGMLLLAVGGAMLWSAFTSLENPAAVPKVHISALWVAIIVLVSKELLFRSMIATARRVRSTMLMANAWHSRSDALSSLVVAIGIAGNLFGYPLLDPIAALIVGFMVAKMGWDFGWNAINDLTDRAVDQEQVAAIERTLAETPGVKDVHDVRTRKMGDMIIVDAHIAVDATITVEAGHDIAMLARDRVMQAHQVVDLLAHVDPWPRPDAGKRERGA